MALPKAREDARGRWPEILVALGVDRGLLDGRHRPCPVCGGVDRFRFDDKDGKGTWICGGHGHSGAPAAGDGLDLVQELKGMDFHTACKLVESLNPSSIPASQPREKPDPRPRLKRIASELVPIYQVEAVATYLVSRRCSTRGLQNVKAHPGLPYYEGGEKIGTFPAMVSAIKRGRKLVSMHITYLDKAGKKAPVPSPRKILPPAGDMEGVAVALYKYKTPTLGIAEGIETAISAAHINRVPVWAALNATLLTKWRPPADVENVHIFGDWDDSFTGQAAAFELARRLKVTRGDGLSVKVQFPDGFNDWNDLMMEDK